MLRALANIEKNYDSRQRNPYIKIIMMSDNGYRVCKCTVYYTVFAILSKLAV